MALKICPFMSNANTKVPCDVNCAFCVKKNGYITCSVNVLMQNSEDINKKLDAIILNQKKAR